VLQTIYFFFWFKQALWGWLVFWFYGKRRMAEQLENSFIDSRFPPPSKYATDLDDYFSEISNNEGLDPTTRVKAAHELGTLNGLKIARRFSMILRINSAAETALKRYARLGESLSVLVSPRATRCGNGRVLPFGTTFQSRAWACPIIRLVVFRA
jgi:hypothetical protein